MRLDAHGIRVALHCVNNIGSCAESEYTEAMDWTHITSNTTELLEGTASYRVVVSSILGLLVICSVFGNVCVISAVALEKSLRSVTNYLIASLAVTDLLVSVLVLPLAAMYQVLNKWTLGQKTCDIFLSLDVLCCTTSILHLCAIALDRYLAITNPVDYMNRRTPKRAALVIALTWLSGIIVALPTMLRWRDTEHDPGVCTISQDLLYTIYTIFGAFYIPLVFLLVVYFKIFKAAMFRIKKTTKKSFGVKENISGNNSSTGNIPVTQSALDLDGLIRANCEAKRKAAKARERRTVKTLGIVVGGFVLCWLPFFIVTFLVSVCKSRCAVPVGVGAVINWLGYSNSMLNPIIYTYFNKDFRNAIKKILQCKYCTPRLAQNLLPRTEC
ncbi:5-hydroxytryptamine receptor 1A-like [Engraulis encrasicolus]|uniref:5-hydroxytryptamine receptor 1A-like n=1 Tax=Engraulis encrasicolus TaxID=184585 RepID=UPI002FD27201